MNSKFDRKKVGEAALRLAALNAAIELVRKGKSNEHELSKILKAVNIDLKSLGTEKESDSDFHHENHFEKKSAA